MNELFILILNVLAILIYIIGSLYTIKKVGLPPGSQCGLYYILKKNNLNTWIFRGPILICPLFVLPALLYLCHILGSPIWIVGLCFVHVISASMLGIVPEYRIDSGKRAIIHNIFTFGSRVSLFIIGLYCGSDLAKIFIYILLAIFIIYFTLDEMGAKFKIRKYWFDFFCYVISASIPFFCIIFN